MEAFYCNEYGESEDCLLLGHNLKGTMALIEIDGEVGYCSVDLVVLGE